MNLFMKNKLRQTLKRAFFFVIYYFGVLNMFIIVQKRFKKRHCAAILFYHRFCSGPSDNYHLPYLDIREFRKQMLHIKKWYRVITMDELTKRLATKEGFSSPSIVITIDDGYLNNYTLAYPILKALGLPAIIYLTTGLIGTNKAPWVDCLMNILSVTKAKFLCFPELLGGEVLDISMQAGKRAAVTKLFQLMLRIEHETKMRGMEKLPEVLAVKENSRNSGERRMLNWDEVIEMKGNNISFGAHTITHPTLSKMDLEEAKREIYESKMVIEERVGRKVRHFAVPNGKEEDFTNELSEFCEEIGFDTIVTTEPGVVDSNTDRFCLKRVLPPPPLYYFACEIARYFWSEKRSNVF